MTATRLSASAARCALLDLADEYGYDAVLAEAVRFLSGDDARDLLESIRTNWELND
jgi:hypothetical protein